MNFAPRAFPFLVLLRMDNLSLADLRKKKGKKNDSKDFVSRQIMLD